MLKWKKSLAYDRAGSENVWTTAFHIAASEGHKSMMHELLKHCPDCWDMVNSNGQNVLHVAILLNDHERFVQALFKLRFCNSLVDKADNEGNTPLHLLAAYGNHVPESILDNPRAKKMTFNKQNQTPLDIASSRTRTMRKEKLVADLRGNNARLGQRRRHFEVKRQTKYSISKIHETRKDDDEGKRKTKREKLEIDKIMKSTQIQVVVATLIMTITFTAGFTLPGGLDNDDGPNKGMAILIKKAAFRVFVISDVLAFTCSAAAIFLYFTMAESDVDVDEEIKIDLVDVLWKNYCLARVLELLAMGAVVIAFVTGTYATLANSLALAVTVCVIGCYFFGIYGWNSAINGEDNLNY
ncbi:hypothetical protein MTR67_032965 [Solanum verrucosum]|uniref:PGG domain-containing protein n=1 Tax=Solanum verrucosum TaxID=315347 RepID=A0AAF0U566_SOLVR|nr:hypothetical protein MTR67_032965 [Solanum verrucosum]